MGRVSQKTIKTHFYTVIPFFGIFEPGDKIDIKFDFENSGSTTLSGTAFALITHPGLAEPVTLYQEFSDLNPGNALPFTLTWNSDGSPAEDHSVQVYVLFSSTSTGVLEGEITALKHNYLPLIIR